MILALASIAVRWVILLVTLYVCGKIMEYIIEDWLI
jgi:hypothetical protein